MNNNDTSSVNLGTLSQSNKEDWDCSLKYTWTQKSTLQIIEFHIDLSKLKQQKDNLRLNRILERCRNA